MRSSPPFPCDMSEVCRLCLSSDEEKLPIFGEDQASLHRTPLPFRILACVSVEVSSQDVLPTVICKLCLQQVNQWHDFKQVCDSSQATLKQWLCQTHAEPSSNANAASTALSSAAAADTTTTTVADADDQVVIKQEPVDVDENPVFDEDIQGLCNDSREYCMLEVKQEEIEVCEENPVEVHNVSSTADPLDVPADRNRKSPAHEEHNSYNSANLVGDNSSSFECENDGDIDFLRVNHGGAISVRGLFDSGESTTTGKKLAQPKKKRRFFKRITFKKKKKKSPPIWTPREARPQNQYGHVCETCGESFPELWLLKSHEKSHGNAENVCTICEKRFSTKSCLVRHIRVHTGQMPYSCSKCAVSFANKSAYMQHCQTACPFNDSSPATPVEPAKSPEKSETPSLSCYICGETYPTFNQLIQHRKTHVNYSCPKCKKYFPGGKSLSNHLRIHKLGAIMAHKMVHAKAPPKVLPLPVAVASKASTCGVCSKVFPSMAMMHRHMVKHTKQKQFSCTICNATMGYATSLHKHMKTMHNVRIDYSSIKANNTTACLEQDADESHTCTICSKTFGQMSLLVSHIKIIHMGVKAYKCMTCGKMFASKPHLVKHTRSHEVGQSSLTCKICCKKFPDVKTYNKHKGVHTRYRCYTCGICSESFNGINSWRIHQMTHLPEFGQTTTTNIAKQEHQPTAGKYTCRLCFKMYWSRAELYEHKKMHIKLKIYSCTECKNSYNSLSMLTKHKQRVHPNSEKYSETGQISDDTYDCEFCSKSFASSTSLRKHKLIHAELLYTNVTRVDPPHRRRFLKTPEVAEPPSQAPDGSPFVCVPCNRSFSDELSLKTHRGWHKRKHASPYGVLQLKASNPSPPAVVSPAKAALSPPSKAKNLTPAYSFWCVECNKGFKKSVNLSRHYKLSQKHNKSQSSAGSMDEYSLKDLSECMPVEVQLVEGELMDSDGQVNDVVHLNSEVHPDDSPTDEAFVNDYTSDPPPEAASASDDALVNDHVGNSSAGDLSGHVSPIISVDVTPNDSYVDDAAASESYVGNVSGSPETPRENGTEFPNGDVNSVNGQKQVFECLVCSKVFKNNNALVRHKGWHSRSPSSRLKSNSLEFVGKSTLPFEASGLTDLASLAPSLPAQTQSYPCSTCGGSFSSAASLSKHKRLHEAPAPPVVVNRTLRPKELVRPPDRMLPDMEVQPAFQCDTCKKYYSSAKSLYKHQKLHARRALPTYVKPLPDAALTPGLPKRLIPTKHHCTLCGQYYRSAETLYKHKRLHLKRMDVQADAPTARAMPPSRSLSRSTDMLALRIGGKYRCEMCFKYYSCKSNLYRHRRLHVKDQQFSALYSTDEPTSMQDAYLAPPEEQAPTPRQQVKTPYQCNVCKRYYSCSGSLYKHRRLHAKQQQASRVVGLAGRTLVQSAFATPSNEQVQAQRQQVRTPYQCDLCKKYYSCTSSLYKHRRLHALQQNISSFSGPEKHTPLPNHIVASPGEPLQTQPQQVPTPYQCNVCKKYYSSATSLYKHKRLHAKQQEVLFVADADERTPVRNTFATTLGKKAQTPYQCDVCKKFYSCSTSLHKHRRLHVARLPSVPPKPIEEDSLASEVPADSFPCPSCPKVFSKQLNLDLHLRCHTGERPYGCDMCPRAFTRCNTLWKHKKRIHHNWTFKCTVCSRFFPFKNVLDVHVRKVHQADPKKGLRLGGTKKLLGPGVGYHSCRECNKSFVYLGALLTHQRMYHAK